MTHSHPFHPQMPTVGKHRHGYACLGRWGFCRDAPTLPPASSCLEAPRPQTPLLGPRSPAFRWGWPPAHLGRRCSGVGLGGEGGDVSECRSRSPALWVSRWACPVSGTPSDWPVGSAATVLHSRFLWVERCPEITHLGAPRRTGWGAHGTSVASRLAGQTRVAWPGVALGGDRVALAPGSPAVGHCLLGPELGPAAPPVGSGRPCPSLLSRLLCRPPSGPARGGRWASSFLTDPARLQRRPPWAP